MEQVQPSIESMNEAIGVFMGGKWADKKIAGRNQKRFYYNDLPFAFVKDTTSLNYHKDWNELMLVVEKIESLENSRFGICIDTMGVIITDYKEEEMQMLRVDKYPDNGDTKMSMTYDAVCKFIQFYNQQKQSI